jgi:CHASE2 domain-containing sensor protein
MWGKIIPLWLCSIGFWLGRGVMAAWFHIDAMPYFILSTISVLGALLCLVLHKLDV